MERRLLFNYHLKTARTDTWPWIVHIHPIATLLSAELTSLAGFSTTGHDGRTEVKRLLVGGISFFKNKKQKNENAFSEKLFCYLGVIHPLKTSFEKSSFVSSSPLRNFKPEILLATHQKNGVQQDHFIHVHAFFLFRSFSVTDARLLTISTDSRTDKHQAVILNYNRLRDEAELVVRGGKFLFFFAICSLLLWRHLCLVGIAIETNATLKKRRHFWTALTILQTGNHEFLVRLYRGLIWPSTSNRNQPNYL